jgi:hypothetical protein
VVDRGSQLEDGCVCVWMSCHNTENLTLDHVTFKMIKKVFKISDNVVNGIFSYFVIYKKFAFVTFGFDCCFLIRIKGCHGRMVVGCTPAYHLDQSCRSLLSLDVIERNDNSGRDGLNL